MTSASGTWSAPASIITIESSVPATMRSRSDSSISSYVGNALYSPSTRPMRTDETGPSNGTWDMPSVVEAPMTPKMSAGFSRSAERVSSTSWISRR